MKKILAIDFLIFGDFCISFFGILKDFFDFWQKIIFVNHCCRPEKLLNFIENYYRKIIFFQAYCADSHLKIRILLIGKSMQMFYCVSLFPCRVTATRSFPRTWRTWASWCWWLAAFSWSCRPSQWSSAVFCVRRSANVDPFTMTRWGRTEERKILCVQGKDCAHYVWITFHFERRFRI